MSVYTGQFGVLQIQDDAGVYKNVAELRNFSISTTTEVIENTTMGDNSRSYFAGLKSFEGTADIFFDEDLIASGGTNDIPALLGGTNQGGSTPPARQDYVGFKAYPNGTTGGEPMISGNIIITAYNVSSSLDGMVEASISFTGTGDIILNGTA